LVPIAILALGYWLIAPLVRPAIESEPAAGASPTAVPRAQPVAPPGLGGSGAAPGPSTAVKPAPAAGTGVGVPTAGPSPSAGQVGPGGAAPSARTTQEAGPAATPPGAVAAGGATSAAAPSAATPTPGVYRGSAVEALKVDPRQVQTVRLGRIEAGTLVRMSVAVAFNSRLSTVTGTPDIDLFVVGPTGTVAAYPGARDGVRVAFEAPSTGEYEVRLDNSKSRINAKRIGIQFG
jgi:hypothetical protein